MKQPAPVYQRIAGHQWRHIWLSGDIHGCLEQLRRKLWHCRFDPWRDLLISVGDVIDRGPQSLRCLQLLEQHWVRAVRGNHEQMAMDALASQQMSLWLMNGGDWFIALADNQQKQAKTALEKCQHLPFILEVHSRTNQVNRVISLMDFRRYPFIQRRMPHSRQQNKLRGSEHKQQTWHIPRLHKGDDQRYEGENNLP
jgi:serine/threonine protein phosphatase 1